ncbi:hypothetical protein KIN20_021497 [Parelaphostrongylus tenuis]|uniref:Uncharacterized protein n=1 Tax=Parelaphostrongylus tenuis TaxID=148309 RepID=A0AAD5QW87_PARTN|nr:hypothetical protein KIN20_021497 [Parelaphostrongylus tenuis]
MQYLPQPARFCMTVKSSKSQRDLTRDQQSTVSISPSVLFSWRRINGARQCQFGFKGYQGEYRLSPDFGAYEECQYSLSRHTYALSEVLALDGPLSMTLRFNSSNSNCPIDYLPTTYVDYVSCTLNLNEWYVLDWYSTIRYETYHNGAYGTYYANHSTSFVFQPTDNLLRNGTEKEWLARLILLDTKTNGCEDASLLVRYEEHWPYSSTLIIHYYIRDYHRIVHEEHLVTANVDRWLQHDFVLHPKLGVHEVCAQMTDKPRNRHRVCRIVVNRMECPFPKWNHATISLPSLVHVLVFLFFRQ